MLLSISTLLFLLHVLFIADISAQSVFSITTDPPRRAERALASLDRWYNVTTGIWESTGWWNAANIMTMVGNLAKAGPANVSLQKRIKRMFAIAFRCAPAKNPQPITEVIGNGSFLLYNRTELEKGYNKYIDPVTYEPHTTFAANWFVATDQHSGSTTPDLDLSKLADDSISPAMGSNPQDWLNGYYDDNLWWSLAWITAYDVTQHVPYLHLAEGIFEAMTKVWPTHCGDGGIYWSWDRTYVNAIPNELFLSTAAHLANRAQDKAYYLNWAQKSLDWFLRTGMLNENGTINDGLMTDCRNNNGTIWSYNQGVILGALVELNHASPNSTHLPLATRIAKAALIELSDKNNIIHDPCEPNCGADGTQFKGVFMRNLQMLQQVVPHDVFKRAIRNNVESIWRNNKEDGVFSVNWAGPFVRPANASTHSSAMDALVADVVLRYVGEV